MSALPGCTVSDTELSIIRPRSCQVPPSSLSWRLGWFSGYLEGWAMSDSAYFTFVTGLTIGYGVRCRCVWARA